VFHSSQSGIPGKEQELRSRYLTCPTSAKVPHAPKNWAKTIIFHSGDGHQIKRASLIRRKGQVLGDVDAPSREAAEAEAVRTFALTHEQRNRLVVQERG